MKKLTLLAFVLILTACGDAPSEVPFTSTVFDDVCAVTTLPCSEISLSYKDLPSNEAAKAYLTNKGNIGVWFNNDNKNLSDSVMKDLMVHELAHLIVFQIDPTNGSHDSQYQQTCHTLADLVDADRGVCTK
jgi:hypothetical protein